jgi:antitoxin component of MazEF toxin-antitoxin module
MTKKKETFTLKVDKAIAEDLGINKDTDLEMYVKDKMLIIKPKRTKSNQNKKQKDKELTKKLMDEYDSILKKLAKT